MKNYAQAILLFTGYPLEPIVALTIQKSYQTASVQTASGKVSTTARPSVAKTVSR